MSTEIQIPKFTSRALGTAAEMPLRAPFTNRSFLKEKSECPKDPQSIGIAKRAQGSKQEARIASSRSTRQAGRVRRLTRKKKIIHHNKLCIIYSILAQNGGPNA